VDPDALGEHAFMSAVRLMLRPIRYGWSVELSDGRELAPFSA
jgi:hypothetical protein